MDRPTALTVHPAASQVANATFSRALAHVDIIWRVGVSLWTMRFPHVQESSISLTAHHVLSMSNELQMRRIYTSRNPTKMVNISFPIRFSIGKCISIMTGNSAMPRNADANKAKDAISSMIEASSPQPTRAKFGTIRWNWPILINLGPEASLGVRKRRTPSKRVSVSNKPHIMGFAVPLSIAKLLTSFNLTDVFHRPIVPENMATYNIGVVS